MGAAEDTWKYIESLLVDECGLMPDCGLNQQRPNLINAIRNGTPSEDVLRAAVEFLNAGEGLHAIRVNGKMMGRKAVAAALSRARDLCIVSYNEKGFWQADLYEGLANLDADEFKQTGPSPDAFFTGSKAENEKDVATRARQRWPLAEVRIVFVVADYDDEEES